MCQSYSWSAQFGLGLIEGGLKAAQAGSLRLRDALPVSQGLVKSFELSLAPAQLTGIAMLAGWAGGAVARMRCTVAAASLPRPIMAYAGQLVARWCSASGASDL